MTKEASTCDDFIIAVIRSIRRSPKLLKESTKAGLALNRLWSVVQHIYTDQEFREGLNRLLQERIVVMTWRIYRSTVLDDTGKSYTHGPTRMVCVTSIPDDLPLEGNHHSRSLDGTFFAYKKDYSASYDNMTDVQIYVVADGLPQKVAAKKQQKSNMIAKLIMAEIQKE